MSCWEAWYGLKTLRGKHKMKSGRVSPTHPAETDHTEPSPGDCPEPHTAVPSPPPLQSLLFYETNVCEEERL